jgi:hypothetical protein
LAHVEAHESVAWRGRLLALSERDKIREDAARKLFAYLDFTQKKCYPEGWCGGVCRRHGNQRNGKKFRAPVNCLRVLHQRHGYNIPRQLRRGGITTW